MASETIITPQMIVPYEWILENVGEEPMTIASKMILFRGEKVFRVGLKNHERNPVLFFMSFDLDKIGMKVKDIMYGIQGSGFGPATIEKMKYEDIGNEGNLQLFTMTFLEKIVGNRTFVFRICIEGTDSGYSYQLSDRLVKDQLWAALKNQQNLADVELIVKDKKFPAHKSILAARSPVFADKFENKQPVKGGLLQIRIDDVEPSTVENFLHFIYTGEPKGTFADEDLLKLSDHYQLTTLSGLCQHALKNFDVMQMAEVRISLNSYAEELSSSKIMPEKETEIFFDRTTPTFRCSTLTLLTKISEARQLKCVMQYQNENICVAYYIGETVKETDDYNFFEVFFSISKPEIHLTCAKHRRFGLKVEDIYCNLQERPSWLKMEPKNCQKNAELLHFVVRSDQRIYLDPPQPVYFYIKTVSTIGNYDYEMMDDLWLTDFWLAATNQKLTDVEIFVGTIKVMEAHRVILCARSPVLNASLNKISNTEKSVITFKAEFEVEIVKHFLNFLYNGSLKTSARSKQLHKLAKMYEVETLKNMCQLINANSPDVEELTNCLIQL